MEYAAGAFHPSHDGSVPGKISLTRDAVRFDSASLEVRIPYSRLEIATGGADGSVVFFSQPDSSQVRLYTLDNSILQDPALSARNDAGRLRKSVSRARRQTRRVEFTMLLYLPALILIAAVGVYLLRAPLVSAIVAVIPASLEKRLGDAAFEQVRAGRTLISSMQVQAALDRMSVPLLQALPQGDAEYRFYLIEDPEPNAFALPGGHIAVHSGLVEMAQSAEEVAGVLAHEIAHVHRRHSLRLIVSRLGLTATLRALFGDMGGVSAVLIDSGTVLTSLKFSRDFESEADALGFELLVGAEIDPRGLLSFLRRLGQEAQTPAAPALIHSHPPSREREARLEEMLANLGDRQEFRRFDFDFAAFQEQVAASPSMRP